MRTWRTADVHKPSGQTVNKGGKINPVYLGWNELLGDNMSKAHPRNNESAEEKDEKINA